MTKKSILRSITFWTQVAATASTAFPVVREFIRNNPEGFVSMLAAVNTLVRFCTSGKVTLFTTE